MSDLKERLKKIERDEPWTNKERDMNPRDKNFIRNIQALYKVDKEKAKEIFSKSNLEGKKAFKRLERRVTKGIKAFYPKHKVFKSKSGEFKRPEVETKSKYQVSHLKTKKGKEQLRSYNKTTIKRVESAQEKYPDASNYELRHGINSKASRAYRLRNTGKAEYTGRVIKRGKE